MYFQENKYPVYVWFPRRPFLLPRIRRRNGSPVFSDLWNDDWFWKASLLLASSRAEPFQMIGERELVKNIFHLPSVARSPTHSSLDLQSYQKLWHDRFTWFPHIKLRPDWNCTVQNPWYPRGASFDSFSGVLEQVEFSQWSARADLYWLNNLSTLIRSTFENYQPNLSIK